uniref:glycosyltransferase n=1 Tax=Vibrio hyugaensis TaxID=1534743 RepID=UPI001CA50A03
LGNNYRNIYLVGKKINPYPWIKNCYFLVHSSVSEGFSLVILEAMISSKLVVSSNCNFGPSDILDGGKFGYLFDVRNHEQLTNILQLILNEPCVLPELERKCYNRAISIQHSAIKNILGFLNE